MPRDITPDDTRRRNSRLLRQGLDWSGLTPDPAPKPPTGGDGPLSPVHAELSSTGRYVRTRPRRTPTYPLARPTSPSVESEVIRAESVARPLLLSLALERNPEPLRCRSCQGVGHTGPRLAAMCPDCHGHGYHTPDRLGELRAAKRAEQAAKRAARQAAKVDAAELEAARAKFMREQRAARQGRSLPFADLAELLLK